MGIERQHAPVLATLSAAVGGLIATMMTATACVGPLLAIVLGIGGFGWLTQYAHLRVVASLTTGVLLLAGFYLAYGRARPKACAVSRSRTLRVARASLWLAALLALLTNAFEYLIFPYL